MESIKKSTMQTLKVVILTLVLAMGVNYVFAVDWAPPSSNPPAGNTPAPLNVTVNGQVKDGGLVLNASRTATYGLQVMNTASQYGLVVTSNGRVGIGNLPDNASLDIFGNIRIRGGTPGAGKVLTSDAEGLGTWEEPAGGGGGGGITGGVANQIPKFLNATTLTNSGVTENSSGQIGIGTTNPGSKLDVNGNVTIRGNGAGFLPTAGKVLTATNSTGLAAWQTGVEVGATTISSSGGQATGQICGLTANKAFLATVNVSAYTIPSVAFPGSLSVNANVNGSTGSQTSLQADTGGTAPLYTPVTIPVVATSNGSGCIQATVTLTGASFYSVTIGSLSIVG